MPRKKTDENVEVIEEFTEDTHTDLTEEAKTPSESEVDKNVKITEEFTEDTYTDPTEEVKPPSESKTVEETAVFITLKNGGSFSSGGYIFKKDEPVPVEKSFAERLLKTGFFERS